MDFIENQLNKWFGMNIYTAVQVLIIAFLTVLFAVGFIFVVVGLIGDPGAASGATYGIAG